MGGSSSTSLSTSGGPCSSNCTAFTSFSSKQWKFHRWSGQVDPAPFLARPFDRVDDPDMRQLVAERGDGRIPIGGMAYPGRECRRQADHLHEAVIAAVGLHIG